MRLTDSHIALTSLSFSRLPFFSSSVASSVSFSFYFSTRADFRVANPSGFCWVLRRMRVSIFSPTHPTSLSFSLVPFLRFFAISWAAYSCRSFCYTRFPRHPWFRAHFRRPKAVPFSPLNQLCALHKSPSNHYASLSLCLFLSLPFLFALCATIALWAYVERR